MDPETENHFAALIMEEAARLRLQAEKEGVHAYLAKPKVRGKPNPQFLKATVRSIAQANRAVEVSGMWKRRARELELEERERNNRRHRHRSDSSRDRSSHFSHGQLKNAANKSLIGHRELSPLLRSDSNDTADCTVNASSNATVYHDEGHSQEVEDDVAEDEGLKEEEIEHFLQSRVKRGRGAVGCRMDETGPYPSAHSGLEDDSNVRVREEWKQQIVGPSREAYERQLSLESKRRKKDKPKTNRAEDCSEDGAKHNVKRKEKQSRKKHRHSHKKAKKGERV